MNTTLKIAKYTSEYVAVNPALYATVSRHSCNPLQSAAFGNHFQMRWGHGVGRVDNVIANAMGLPLVSKKQSIIEVPSGIDSRRIRVSDQSILDGKSIQYSDACLDMIDRAERR